MFTCLCVCVSVCLQTDSQFSRYGLLGTDIRVSSESHVVAIMEFPRDVREDVVLVYHTPRKRETVTEPSQREKRVAVLSLFSNTPVVYGHRPSGGHMHRQGFTVLENCLCTVSVL